MQWQCSGSCGKHRYEKQVLSGKGERMIKKLGVFVLTLILALGMVGCGGKDNTDGQTDVEMTQQNGDANDASNVQAQPDAGSEADDSSDATGESVTGLHHIEIEVEGYGTIYCELDADVAPITVQNFLDLAKAGFYDGLTFHRVVEGFVIQGGDPLGNGTGGSEQNITGEFLVNGYNNTLSHTRGVLSMARAMDYNSASSQFFIMHQDGTYLDGQYAAFGYVTDGMDIVDAIVADTPVQDIQSGFVAQENQPVITKITVVD